MSPELIDAIKGLLLTVGLPSVLLLAGLWYVGKLLDIWRAKVERGKN